MNKDLYVTRRFIWAAGFIILFGALVACKKESSPAPTSVFVGFFSPARALPGAEVLISGANFSSNVDSNEVLFIHTEALVGDTTRATILSATNSQLRVVVPSSLRVGNYSVTINNFDNDITGTSSSSLIFTVFIPEPPTVTGITPATGAAGTLVTITGTKFDQVAGTSQVLFNGRTGLIFESDSNQLVAQVPLGSSTGPVQVFSNGFTTTGPTFNYISTTAVVTVAGSGLKAYVTDTSLLRAAFSLPTDIALTSDGNVVVADAGNHRIRLINFGNSRVSTFAGKAQGYADGNDTLALFNTPVDVALAPNGDLIVADAGNHAIRRISPSRAVTTVAGGGAAGFTDGTGTAARFNQPYGVVVTSTGIIYVADYGNHAIRRIDASGNVTTLAGNGTAGFLNAQGAAARFNRPIRVALDNSGNVLVSDYLNNVLRSVDAGGNVTTRAGSGTQGYLEGSTAAAQFNRPVGIAVDAAGNIFVSDNNNHRIRRITTGNMVETYAGLGINGFNNGPVATALFNTPQGIALDALGNLYVADYLNQRIRLIGPN